MPTLVLALRALACGVTAVSATFLIVLKISLVTRKSHTPWSYRKTIEIIVESSVLVSTVFWGMAILGLITYWHPFRMSTATGRFCYQMLQYLTSFQFAVVVRVGLSMYMHYHSIASQGIAPTLIAFRVAQVPSEPKATSKNRTGPLSRLIFRRTAHSTGVNTQPMHTQASTIPITSSQREERVDGIQGYTDAEMQSYSTLWIRTASQIQRTWKTKESWSLFDNATNFPRHMDPEKMIPDYE